MNAQERYETAKSVNRALGCAMVTSISLAMWASFFVGIWWILS